MSGALQDRLLADLRGIPECDRKEQGCNRESEDEDVSEAFHRLAPVGRSAEGGACRGHEAIGQTTSGAITKFLEDCIFNLNIWSFNSRVIYSFNFKN